MPAGALLALFMGTGFERKGLVHLLRALPDAGEQIWLVVAGRDAEADSYRALARSLGIVERVRFLGPVPQPDLLYAAADVLVLPTLYEPFSNACLEAMACGLPVVTTRAAGVSELLPDRLDSLTLPAASDHATLTRALRRLQDPDERRALGADARAVAERRSLEIMTEEFLEAYRSLGPRRGLGRCGIGTVVVDLLDVKRVGSERRYGELLRRPGAARLRASPLRAPLGRGAARNIVCHRVPVRRTGRDHPAPLRPVGAPRRAPMAIPSGPRA